MSYEEMWLDCADKLTGMIQNIIEFAKLIPGFMKLTQDDQILLLKSGKYDVSITISCLLKLIETGISKKKFKEEFLV